jgi:hypothetical protein
MNLDDPVTVALLADDVLRAAGIPHALYGGLVLSAYGEARETRDADLAVLEPDADATAAALERVGVKTLVAFRDARFGGLNISRVTLTGGRDATGLNTIDLVAPRDRAYAARVLDRSVEVPFAGRPTRVVGIEDFVVIQVLSTRDKDLDDAASVLVRAGNDVDADAVARECDALADALPDVAVAARWQEVVRRAASSPRTP